MYSSWHDWRAGLTKRVIEWVRFTLASG